MHATNSKIVILNKKSIRKGFFLLFSRKSITIQYFKSVAYSWQDFLARPTKKNSAAIENNSCMLLSRSWRIQVEFSILTIYNSWDMFLLKNCLLLYFLILLSVPNLFEEKTGLDTCMKNPMLSLKKSLLILYLL